MGVQPSDAYDPLIPMPELTPDALRAAVSRIAPGKVPALTRHLFEATANALQIRSLAPLRAFIHSWAVFVAIERHPARAARLRALEHLVDAGHEDPTGAIAEIHEIRQRAVAETCLTLREHRTTPPTEYVTIGLSADVACDVARQFEREISTN
ncbi:hypothetical protein [Streptomyces sodiiphilus]|uniref:hypothetical protein n=1 Tax=Streptomyces sodiiphilus TaxID=226217 RepID=UPI0031D74D5A